MFISILNILTICDSIHLATIIHCETDSNISLFKCEQYFALLQEKMLRQHDWFGDFSPVLCTSIRTTARDVYKHMRFSNYTLSSTYRDTVFASLFIYIDRAEEVCDHFTLPQDISWMERMSVTRRKRCSPALLLADNSGNSSDKKKTKSIFPLTALIKVTWAARKPLWPLSQNSNFLVCLYLLLFEDATSVCCHTCLFTIGQLYQFTYHIIFNFSWTALMQWQNQFKFETMRFALTYPWYLTFL